MAVSYPEATPINLKVEMSAGALTISPGADVFVSGQAICNIPEFAPQVSSAGGNVSIRQRDGMNVQGIRNFRNEWDLKLGNAQPFSLIIKTGASRDTFQLGGLPIAALKVEFGAGQASIRFDSPNPQRAEQIVFQGGAGQAHISGLLNANASQLTVEVGAGSTQLDFTGGELHQDMQVKIGAGVGRMTLNVKQGLAVRIETERFLSVMTVSGDFRDLGNGVRQTPDYATTTGPKLTIKVSATVGKIEVNSVSA